LGIEVREEQSWVLIGNTGFHRIDWLNRWAELGIVIGEKTYWNQGYGTEAVQAMVAIAFTLLNLNRVQLEVYDFNHRARRAYEKAGFRLVPRQPHHGRAPRRVGTAGMVAAYPIAIYESQATIELQWEITRTITQRSRHPCVSTPAASDHRNPRAGGRFGRGLLLPGP